MSDNQETNCKGLGSHTCPESHTTLRFYKSKDELRKGLRHRNRHRMFASIFVTFATVHAGGALHAARHADGKIVVSNANVEALMLLFGGVLFVVYEFYLICRRTRAKIQVHTGAVMSVHDRKTLGVRLRDAREYLGFSQDEVARAVGLTRSAVSLVESGQRRVDALELKRLAELYQRQVADFTGDVDASRLASDETVQHLARAASKLTEADQAELLRFAEFLGARGSPKRESGT